MRLTEKQIRSLERVLLHVTDDTLKSLENVFSLDISSSDSCIRLITALDNEVLKPIGSGTLYTVKSGLEGQVEGQVLVLMRVQDFRYLGRLMKPVLARYFGAGTGKRAPDSGSGGAPIPIEAGKDARLNAQMMELLEELGNILCGVYSRALYKVCGLDSHHGMPVAAVDRQQNVLQKLFGEPAAGLQPLLVLENEYFVQDNPVRFWGLIAPAKASFMRILLQLEEGDDETSAAINFAQNEIGSGP